MAPGREWLVWRQGTDVTAGETGGSMDPRGDGGVLTVALVVGIAAELLVAACALAAWRLHWARRHRLEQSFALAQVQARRLALDARIVDASIAELSELVVADALRELGLDSPSDPR